MTTRQRKAHKWHEQWLKDEARRIEVYRQDQTRWIRLLESLLLDAEDVAMTRGDWGLCECFDRAGGRYQSQSCADVINNIRGRIVRNTQ